jgi:hypothetical protein
VSGDADCVAHVLAKRVRIPTKMFFWRDLESCMLCVEGPEGAHARTEEGPGRKEEHGRDAAQQPKGVGAV